MATWNPADYARNSVAQWQWAKELQSRLALDASESLLDLGCGDGKITAELAQSVAQGRVVGIDSSEEMIRYAQAQFPPSHHPNLSFRLLDVRSLDYNDEFDIIFSNAALHWVDDHQKLLAGTHRALRTGGRLLFSFGGKGNAAAIMEIAFAVGQTPQWREYFRDFQNPYYFYSAEDYRPWLTQAGFTATQVQLVPKPLIHPGPEALTAWIRTTWMPITSRVTESQREHFIRDFVSAYIQRFPPDPQGNIHVQMVRLEVDARKK